MMQVTTVTIYKNKHRRTVRSPCKNSVFITDMYCTIWTCHIVIYVILGSSITPYIDRLILKVLHQNTHTTLSVHKKSYLALRSFNCCCKDKLTVFGKFGEALNHMTISSKTYTHTLTDTYIHSQILNWCHGIDIYWLTNWLIMLIPKTKLCETARIINNYYKQNTHSHTPTRR